MGQIKEKKMLKDRLKRSIQIYALKYANVGLIANTKAEKKMFYKRRNILIELDIINSKPIEMCELCISIERNTVLLIDTRSLEDIHTESFGYGDDYSNYDIVDALQKTIIQYYLAIKERKNGTNS